MFFHVSLRIFWHWFRYMFSHVLRQIVKYADAYLDINSDINSDTLTYWYLRCIILTRTPIYTCLEQKIWHVVWQIVSHVFRHNEFWHLSRRKLLHYAIMYFEIYYSPTFALTYTVSFRVTCILTCILTCGLTSVPEVKFGTHADIYSDMYFDMTSDMLPGIAKGRAGTTSRDLHLTDGEHWFSTKIQRRVSWYRGRFQYTSRIRETNTKCCENMLAA